MSWAKATLFYIAAFFAFAFGCAALNHFTYLTEARWFFGTICVGCSVIAGWLAHEVAGE